MCQMMSLEKGTVTICLVDVIVFYKCCVKSYGFPEISITEDSPKRRLDLLVQTYKLSHQQQESSPSNA
jgi:hypothetical protein